MHAIIVLEVDGKIIENVTDLFRVADGPGDSATHAHRPDRMLPDRPVTNIKIMHVLFDDVVAARPHEVVPVIELVRQVRVRNAMPCEFRPLVEPNALAIPVAAHGRDVADL